MVLCFCLGALGSAAPSYRIGGTVVDATSGEILRNAVVTIGNSQGEEILLSTTTGEDGGFRFDGLAAGKYWLRAEAKGFSRQAFEEHQGFFTGIVTGGEVDSEHLMFALHPDGSIVGQIVDEANDPARDAQVMLFQRVTQDGKEVTGLHSSTGVNDEGHYRFSHLPAGKYFIVVVARPWYAQNALAVRTGTVASVEGSPDTPVAGGTAGTQGASEPEPGDEADRALDVTYPVTYYPGATEESGATPLVLEAGQRLTADVRLSPVRALHLQVQKPPAGGAENVSAILMQRIFDGPEQQIQGGSTQAETGEIEITGVAPGDYEVRMQSFGKTQQSWSQHVVLKGDTEIAFDRSSPSALVKGVLKMDGGATGMKRGFVQLRNRATDERFATQASEKGEFEFSTQPVGPGSYEVDAGTSENARVSGLTAAGAKVFGQNIEIGGATTVELTITLRAGLGTVNGTVLRDGKASPGEMVVLVPRDLQNHLPLVRRDQSDLDGTFTLRAVLPGKYTVVAIHDGWNKDWMNPQVLDGFLKRGTTVDVTANKSYDVKVAVE